MHVLSITSVLAVEISILIRINPCLHISVQAFTRKSRIYISRGSVAKIVYLNDYLLLLCETRTLPGSDELLSSQYCLVCILKF